MTILRHAAVITTARRPLARLAGGLLWLAASTTAAADWRSDAVDTLVRESAGHRLVVLGELHGTREVPLLVGDLVEHLSTAEPVLLALEIPVGEHAALRDAVSGADAAIDPLRQRPWWRIPAAENDGRRSEDALALVERIARLRRTGRDVAVLPFDPRGRRCFELGTCEAAMAHVIRRAHAALPRGRIVVVTGNVHAMRQRPHDASALLPQLPMTAHLRDLDPLSVDIAAHRGEFWACMDIDHCGPAPVTPPGESGPQPDEAAFDYRLVLPAFSPILQVGAAPNR